MDNISKTVFLQTALRKKRYICEFGKLGKTRGKSVDEKKNYLDDYIPAGDRTTDMIKERIELKKKECGKYKLITNNCEHLATFVRYNISLSLQVSGRLNNCNINVFIIFYKVISGGF